MNESTIELEGVRVKLLPLKETYIDALFEASKDSRIWELSTTPIQSRADMMLYVRRALEEQEQGVGIPFVVYDKSTDTIIGSTRLFDISLPHRQLEIGHTWYHPSVWRTRINTESKYLLLRHSFESIGTIRVQLKTDLRNTRSQAAIARLGAIKEGILRSHCILHDGYVRDTAMFSIIKQEWPTVKARLEQFLK
jgi:RimJ/RimL family protein N-acetyltransferase